MPDRTTLEQKMKAMSLFSDFSAPELGAFLELVETVQVAKGTVVVKQDDPGDCMYFLAEGSVRVVHHSEGMKYEIATLGAGDFLGELALVDEGPRSADVEAIEDCLLIRLDQAGVGALAGVCPSAAFKLLISVGRVLVSRLRAGNRRYIDSLVLLGASAHRAG